MSVVTEEQGKTSLSLAAGVVPGNLNVLSAIARAADRAARPGEVYVISSFLRDDPGSLHDRGLACDISKRQSTGSLWRLFSALLLEGPDELFYRGKLLDQGQPFVDAELTADHLDHLHAGWDEAPTGSGLPIGDLGLAGNGGGSNGSPGGSGGLSLLLDGTTWVRAAEVIGGGLLVVGGLVTMGRR